MKKILLGFLVIGSIAFVGCDKDDVLNNEKTDAIYDKVTTESENTDKETTISSGEDENTNTDKTSDEEIKDTTNTNSSIRYGSGASDVEGNIYKSVIIGTQEWMSSNLRTGKYADGTAIPNVIDGDQWKQLNTGAWCHYDIYYLTDIEYDATYGKLYNWYAVANNRKLCPFGWHVPSDDEWTILTDYLAANGHSGTEGKALKAAEDWYASFESESGNGTDDYGWNGLPGGYRANKGYFMGIKDNGSWWSSTEAHGSIAWYRKMMDEGSHHIGRPNFFKESGYSVRCLKD